MKTIDILEDLSKLSYVDKTVYTRLVDTVNKCIAHALYEELQNDACPVVECDIGVGTLVLSYIDNEIKYKFIPTVKLEKVLTKTIADNESPLITEVESVLTKKIINTYKDLM